MNTIKNLVFASLIATIGLYSCGKNGTGPIPDNTTPVNPQQTYNKAKTSEGIRTSLNKNNYHYCMFAPSANTYDTSAVIRPNQDTTEKIKVDFICNTGSSYVYFIVVDDSKAKADSITNILKNYNLPAYEAPETDNLLDLEHFVYTSLH